MASYARVAVVTGANKGIGLAIVRSLAQNYPTSALNTGSLCLYLAARSPERGTAAVQSLTSDSSLTSLTAHGGPVDIKFTQLDISSPDSITSFAEALKTSHSDGIDVVINNAGIALKGFDNAVVKETLECNYYGALAVCRAVLPLLKDAPSSRIVNVSSSTGHPSLRSFGPDVQKILRDAETVADVDAAMQTFVQAVKDGQEKEKGWPSAAYATSKTGLTFATRALAREVKGKGGKVLVNSCDPGNIKTDMAPHWTKETSEGAKTPVLLALGEGIGTGGFWAYEKEVEF